ncbi:MAG: Glucoamylase, intracellular sporulation-specific [Vezdaea aestivalis]|nr:MAG: Glucoamylase, intracellular sporulation-specific [Vezdaea aestivalis]
MSFFTRNLAQIGGSDPFLEGYLDRYVALQQKLQRLDNPSGGFGDLSGLGEPKFLANGKAFTADWGRPQRDGPALRALTCIAYLRAYNASHSELWASTSPHGQADWYKGFYESTLPATSLIKADLEYVAKYWDTTGFDIWEEVDGLHFFTAMVQRRALREGADIAARFGDSGAASWYIQQQNDILNRLKMFWDSYHGRLMASVGTLRSGLDCANLLGAIHGETDDTDKYPPWSDEVLLGLLDLVEDQRSRFKINASPGRKAKALEGVVIGRYPEDIYDGDGFSGGNPWFLCTIAVSEVLFKAATRFRDQGRLTVTESGVRFWKALTGSDVKGEVTGSALENCTRALVAAGDSFLAAMRRYVDNEGGMSEQIDGKSGAQTGARDLTWSYSAFLSAIDARNAALGKN